MIRRVTNRCAWAATILIISAMAAAAACNFEPQGEGRVSVVIDAQTFRLQDGREIRLAGIVPAPGDSSLSLATLMDGRDVHLRGVSDVPDRYGRQSFFAFIDDANIPVQIELLSRGQALFSGMVADNACAADFVSAEMTARNAQKGTWANTTSIKNAERPADILAAAGQFVVVEGRVLSVRQAGSTFYVNFDRRWSQGFAATISKRTMASLETVGLVPRSLENRQIRVRGWVEQRQGPRIEVFQAGQIELLNERKQ